MKQAYSLLSVIVILLAMTMLSPTDASAKLYMGKITMTVGETREVSAVPTSSAYTASGSFSKSGTCVAITANGSYYCKIKANYVGTGTISYWGSVARSNTWTTEIYDLYWDVEVKTSSILVNQVAIYPSSLTMEVGDEKNLLELITPINATNQKVDWSSENPEIASVSPDGRVKAESMGTTNIICKATDGSGKQAICPVEVRAKNGEFKANNSNGIEILYHIISEEDKTCAVGEKWDGRAVNQETTGALVIPSSVEGYTVIAIGSRAFLNCASITSVELPSTIKKIKDSAFYGCTSLKHITGISGIEYTGNTVFSQTPWYDALPNGPIYIGKTYYGYKGEMPENTTIKIKEGTKSIAPSAFKVSSGSDGSYGHGNNKKLVAVEIPASVVQIGRENMELDIERLVFNCPDIVGAYPNPFDCPHLQSIVIDSDNEYYESPENCNAIIEKRTGMLIAACNNTVIPSSVTIIAPDAFGLNGMKRT